MNVLPRYDAIIIGAGHNGLAAGSLLARDGLRTLVVERGDVVGGMAVTDEALLPGFRHHAHANALNFTDLAAGTGGLDLARLGVETIAPEAQHGICFRDGRPPIVLYRPDQTERSLRSLRRYSHRDARTFGLLKARADGLTTALARAFFSPPHAARLDEHRAAVAAAYRDLGVADGIGSRTAKALIDDVFETPEVRTLMYRLHMEFGGALREPGGDASFLGLVLWLLGRRRLPKGGMSRVVEGQRRELEAAGGQILMGAAVAQVCVEAGRATGVVIEGIGEIAASLVVSSLGVLSTYRGLLAPEALEGAVRRELERFDAAPSPAIGGLKFCLREAPRYKGMEAAPDIGRCLQVFIGLDDPVEAVRHDEDVALGLLPAPAGSIRLNTLWDDGQAPAGRHSAGADCAFPDLRSLSADMTEAVRRSYAAAFVETWNAYAPNVDDENLLALAFELSGGEDRKLLLRPGAEQYRTPAAGLYLAGASTYPGGGVHGACAHNAVNVIRQDRAEP